MDQVAKPPGLVLVWHDSHKVEAGTGMWFVGLPITTAESFLAPVWQLAQPEVLPLA
ncbi:MAG: hypothetical protein HY306_13130 [Nitrosomonadales bacterium]|nr:hypothetical protein [Nitrosomonadales bacterium]